VRAFLSVLGTIALLLGALGMDVSSLRDRSVFVPPPDAVSETFVRQVLLERYEPVRNFLTEDERSRVSIDSLVAFGDSLRRVAGKHPQIATRVESMDDSMATAAAALTTDRGSEALRIQLRWDGTAWRIAGIGQR
jgi:hypothetical protein